jgi:hypothetical protein
MLGNGRSRRSISRLAVTVALLGSMVFPAAAEAISRSEANRVALRALKPQNVRGPTVVFGLPRPLAESARVGTLRGKQARLSRRELGRRAWLFWLDTGAAVFQHPSTLLLVDDGTGRVLRRQRLTWLPLVNGRRPAFLRSARAYASRKYQIYSDISGRAGSARTAARLPLFGMGLAQPIAVTPLQLADSCLVTIGDRASPDLKRSERTKYRKVLDRGDTRIRKDLTAMEGLADALKLRRYQAMTTNDLADEVRGAINRGCRDVFLFVAGHGTPTEGPGAGPPSVVVEQRVLQTAGRSRDEVEQIDLLTPEDIAKIMREHHGSADFKVKIMSCFAGRFREAIEEAGKYENPDGSEGTNLRVLELSSAANEPSFFDLPGVTARLQSGEILEIRDDQPNPNGVSEFTNRDIQGLIAWATDPGMVAEDDGDLGKGIARSHKLGERFDFAHRVGLTNSILVDNPNARPRPQPGNGQPQFGLSGSWTPFGPGEVQGSFSWSNSPRRGIRAAQATTIDALRVVVPPAGGTPRQIVNQLCGGQLPNPTVSTTNSPNDTLTCDGGSLAAGQAFQLNVQTNPPPSAGMGGSAFGRYEGQFRGPFAISGP